MKLSFLSSFSPASGDWPGQARQRLVIGWFAILVVCILLIWLSGGLLPTPWRLMGHLLLRWGTLQPALGSGIFLPFTILLIQSLLLVAAWVMIILAVKNEISVLHAILAQQRVMRLQATMNADTDVVKTKSQGLQLMPEDADRQQDNPVRSTGIQIMAPEKEEDLFDADMAVFELFSEPSEADDAKDDNVKNIPEKKEEESVFVFGNPFEGKLPEVFDYDMDLRREVQDLKKSMHASQQDSEDSMEESLANEDTQRDNTDPPQKALSREHSEH